MLDEHDSRSYWMRPIQDFSNAPPLYDNRRDQFGLESYWKLLMTPDLWVTPGVQLLFDPSFNDETDFIAIAQLKFRLFF